MESSRGISSRGTIVSSSSSEKSEFREQNTIEIPLNSFGEKLISPKTGKVIKIAFFDYPDVFEDFYPHYGVSLEDFSFWHNTANHAWLGIIQDNIGKVSWYMPCIKPKKGEVVHKKIGFTLKYLPSSFLHRLLWKSFYLPSFAWKWQRYYRKYAVVASYLAPLSFSLIRALIRDKPDILFVQDYCSGKFDILVLFSKLLRIPLLTFHSGSTSDKYLGKFLRKYTIPKADWIFSSGKKETHLLESQFHIPNNRITIIRPPIDTITYQIRDKTTACLKTNLNPTRRYLLFVGRFEDAVKRISAIIYAFKSHAEKYKDVDLLIIGSGKDENDLKGLAKELVPGRVIFPGWITDEMDKSWYYNASECLILASWREASPAVIGEAFSCGIPLISSRVGGISDMVLEDQTGWLFEAGDDEALGSCMEKVMANPEKIIQMKPKIREIAEKTVSYETIEKSLRKGFESVFNSKTN